MQMTHKITCGVPQLNALKYWDNCSDKISNKISNKID